MVGAPDFFLDRPLGGETGAGLGFAQTIARHHPAELLRGVAGADDDPIEVVLVACLEQQRDVGDRETRGGGKRDEPLADAAVDFRVDDRLEVARGRRDR